MKDLEPLRGRIDRIDEAVLKLLNKRARIALEIGRIKRNEKAKFYSPERERQIFEKILALNKGPLPGDALKSIFREILSASLSLEEPLKVAYFGPAATFTHLAAMRHFGSSADFMPMESIKGVFDAVDSGKSEFGVVPIENTTEGVISYTLDMFMDFDLKIASEIILEVSQNLLSKSGDKNRIKKIYSHPPATTQCRRWLETKMPFTPVIEVSSTAKAAELASKEDAAAAIASELAAKVYDLRFVESKIEDSRHNVTRFLVISGESYKKTGKDKTSIMFSIKDRPGALYDILSPLKKSRINLTKIESRPSRRKAWEYIFFVDMEGHISDKKVKNAIGSLKDGCLYLKILGSYPYGKQI